MLYRIKQSLHFLLRERLIFFFVYKQFAFWSFHPAHNVFTNIFVFNGEF